MDIYAEPDVPGVSCEDVKNAIDSREKCVILDVRTPGEYARGKIAGSVNLPVDRIECDVERIVPDKSAKVYVYCLTGSRSAHAVDTMVRLGYGNVVNMRQGILAWRAKYFPTVS